MGSPLYSLSLMILLMAFKYAFDDEYLGFIIMEPWSSPSVNVIIFTLLNDVVILVAFNISRALSTA